MSKINIKHFVDINIKHHESTNVTSTRDTVQLIVAGGVASSGSVTVSSMTDYADKFKSQPVMYNATNPTDPQKYAQIYFENGGIKLQISQGAASQATLEEMIRSLSDDIIVVAYVGDISYMKTTAINLANDSTIYGTNEKILLLRDSVTTNDYSNCGKLAVKYSEVTGAEMSIAAYLSRINVYGVDTVRDYCYTRETDDLKATIGDSTFEEIQKKYYNVDIELAGATRNIGGDLVNGYDIVNEYTLIILHQTLSERLLRLLTQKIKGNAGLSAIRTVMAQELSNYLTNGYLTTDKVWTDEPLIKTYNGVDYTIVDTNTPLLLGYIIKILPLTALTADDAAARKIPPIYIVIADSYGIRTITIEGEVY